MAFGCAFSNEGFEVSETPTPLAFSKRGSDERHLYAGILTPLVKVQKYEKSLLKDKEIPSCWGLNTGAWWRYAVNPFYTNHLHPPSSQLPKPLSVTGI